MLQLRKKERKKGEGRGGDGTGRDGTGEQKLQKFYSIAFERKGEWI